MPNTKIAFGRLLWFDQASNTKFLKDLSSWERTYSEILFEKVHTELHYKQTYHKQSPLIKTENYKNLHCSFVFIGIQFYYVKAVTGTVGCFNYHWRSSSLCLNTNINSSLYLEIQDDNVMLLGKIHSKQTLSTSGKVWINSNIWHFKTQEIKNTSKFLTLFVD